MASTPSSGSSHYEETAVPTLKVMRLQSPELDQVRELLFLGDGDAILFLLQDSIDRLTCFNVSRLQDRWKANASLDHRSRYLTRLEVRPLLHSCTQ